MFIATALNANGHTITKAQTQKISNALAAIQIDAYDAGVAQEMNYTPKPNFDATATLNKIIKTIGFTPAQFTTAQINDMTDTLNRTWDAAFNNGGWDC